MYHCPNCDARVAHRASSCARCNANFVGESSWKPLSPTACQANRQTFSWFPWLWALGLVLFFVGLVHALEFFTRKPELFAVLFVALTVLIPACLGVYFMWHGLSLMHARDFGRRKWPFEIDPKRVRIAATLIGFFFMCAGILFVSIGGCFLFRLPVGPWLLAGFLCKFILQVLIWVFKKRDT